MESLSTVLRRVPLFADLPPGSLARIIADLREECHIARSTIFREGDPGHDFYIIKSGELEVRISHGAGREELVDVMGAGNWFGERALFSGRPRSATVVARTQAELWRLPKDKFDALLEENPWLIHHFLEVLSNRLYERNRELSKTQYELHGQIQWIFDTCEPRVQRFLTHTAVLAELEPGAVLALGEDPGIVEECAPDLPLIVREDGRMRLPEAVRRFLLDRLSAEVGPGGRSELHRSAALAYEKAQRWEEAIDQHLHAGEAVHAAELLRAHLDALLAAGKTEVVRRWTDRLPSSVLSAAVPGVLGRLHAKSQEVTEASGRAEALRLPQWIGTIVGIAAGSGLWLIPPFEGLTPEAMRMLALLAWAASFWAFDVWPDFVVGIGLVLGWIVFEVVPAEVALSGFTSTPFFLIIGAFGIAATLQSSGLLFRLALHIMRWFPLTHRGQSLGLALTGAVVGSCIPSTTSGVAIAAPIILALSDSLGYARRSNGSAALAMAALLGIGQLGPFILTAATENLLAWGLLSEAARSEVSWGTWVWAALPMLAVTFPLAFLATMRLLPPEAPPTVSRELLTTQIEALQEVSRAELLSGLVLFAAVTGWITVPYHHVDSAWIALAGTGLLLASKLLDRSAFRAGIYWDFLFYLGAVLSLTGVVRHLHVDSWVIARITPAMDLAAAHPVAFVVVVAVAVYAARFILPSFPLVSLFTITLLPIAAQAGIAPLALVLVICTATNIWFLPYQSTYYLALYFGTKEQAFTHAQVRALAWTYGLIYLLAIAAAIPWWRALGLLRF